jgi:hypothetical protein
MANSDIKSFHLAIEKKVSEIKSVKIPNFDSTFN